MERLKRGDRETYLTNFAELTDNYFTAVRNFDPNNPKTGAALDESLYLLSVYLDLSFLALDRKQPTPARKPVSVDITSELGCLSLPDGDIDSTSEKSDSLGSIVRLGED